MRLLYLNHNVAWTGGTFLRALACGSSMAQRGHDVTLLTISPDLRSGFRVEGRAGVTIVQTPDLFWGRGRSGWDPWDVLNRLAYVQRRRDWDVIHSWDCRPVAILPALWARTRATGRACLVTDWADWWGRGGTQGERPGAWMRLVWPLETFFEESFRSRADATTTISTPLRDRVIGLGCPPGRVMVLPQGCGPVHQGERVPARQRLGIAHDAELVLYVGRLNRSDASLLFDTLARLLSSRPRVHVAIVGRHGAAIPPAMATDRRVVVTGPVDDATLTDYLAASDLSVVAMADNLASRARWPSKINGLLAAGRAVVVSQVGDLPAWLARERAAVVTEATAAALAEGATALLENPDLRMRTEMAGMRLAEGALSWTTIGADLDRFYRSLR